MTTATLERPLMDVKEVAVILNEGEEQVRMMTRTGELGCIRRNSRSIRFTQDHIDAYLARFEVPAADAAPAAKPARNPNRRYSK